MLDDDEVDEVVTRWLSGRTGAAARQQLAEAAAATAMLPAFSFVLPTVSQNTTADVKPPPPPPTEASVLSALAAVHPALARMEGWSRRMLRMPLYTSSTLALAHTATSDTPASGAAQQQCDAMWSRPACANRHSRNALELLGVAQVINTMAQEQQADKLGEVAHCRFKEAAALLKALVTHYTQKLRAANSFSRSPPEQSEVRRCAKLQLGLVHAYMGLREYGLAQAALNEAQTWLKEQEEAGAEMPAGLPSKIAEVKKIIGEETAS